MMRTLVNSTFGMSRSFRSHGFRHTGFPAADAFDDVSWRSRIVSGSSLFNARPRRPLPQNETAVSPGRAHKRNPLARGLYRWKFVWTRFTRPSPHSEGTNP